MVTVVVSLGLGGLANWLNEFSDKRCLKDTSKVRSEAASVCLSHRHAHEYEHNPNAKSPFLMKREKCVIGRECNYLY